MPLIETLAPRRLFAVAGLDPTFANGGTLKPAGAAVQVFLATNRAIYAEIVDGTGAQFLAKYAENGTPDTTFGTAGRVRLTAGTGAAYKQMQLASDERTGAVYFAAVRTVGTEITQPYARVDTLDTLMVQRFDAHGVRDTAFDGDGLFAYGAPASTNTFYDRTFKITLGRLTALPHGQLLIPFDRSDTLYGGGTFADTDTAHASEDVVLLRLRGGGEADLAFGNNGIAVAQGGSLQHGDGDDYSRSVVNRPKLADVQFLANGGYRVIDLRDRATDHIDALGTESHWTETLRGTRYADSTVLSAGGIVDAAHGYSVVVSRVAVDAAPYLGVQEFVPLTASAIGTDGVGVIGATRRVNDRAAATTHLAVVRFRPGVRSAAAPLGTPARASGGVFARNAGGVTIVITKAALTRLNPDLTLDPTWGDAGTSTFDAAAQSGVDDAGRFLYTNAGTLCRINAA